MAKESRPESPEKYELTFEDEQSVEIWKYDKTKFKNGPISVEIRWKASYLKEFEESKKKKSTLQLAREAKKKAEKDKRNERF